MTSIIKPLVYGAIIGGIGLTIGARSIVDRLDSHYRPAYESVRPKLQQLEDLEEQKVPLYIGVGEGITRLRSKVNTAGTITSRELEELARQIRNKESGIARIDGEMSSIRNSTEYRAYEAENARIDREMYIFRRIASVESGLLLLAAGAVKLLSRRKKPICQQ